MTDEQLKSNENTKKQKKGDTAPAFKAAESPLTHLNDASKG